jgi:hypothetical protein
LFEDQVSALCVAHSAVMEREKEKEKERERERKRERWIDSYVGR